MEINIEAQYREVIRKIYHHTNGVAVSGMSDLGMTYQKNRGVDIMTLRALAKETGKNHELAMMLWRNEGFREARILATLIEDPAQVSPTQLDEWINGVNTLEIAEQACMNLLDKTVPKFEKSMEWCFNPKPLVKYTGFMLLNRIAFVDKNAPDSIFENYFPAIELSASNPETYVRRAILQALQRISERSSLLRQNVYQLLERLKAAQPEFAEWAKAELDCYLG